MNDVISRNAAITTAKNAYTACGDRSKEDYRDMLIACLEELPSAQPEITLLQATKTALEFIELCGGTTAFLITPDGEKLSCDWGYVEEGLRELVRYAERRTDG